MPAATVLRLTEVFTAPSTSSETEAVMSDGITELVGQLTLVLKRFSMPEKIKSCRFCNIVLLNVVAFCNAAGSHKESPSQWAAVRSRYRDGNMGMLTLEHIASVDVAW